MELGKRFREALLLALDLHAGQSRKGTTVPYASHLLGSAALVMQFGGTEDQAIAGLLHDAAEDAGGRPVLERIHGQFGEQVARIVEGCTDSFEDPRPPWRERKERYLVRLAGENPHTLLVCACDKLENARALAADLRRDGIRTLERFSGGRETLWYYGAVTAALRSAGRGTVVEEVVSELEALLQEMRRITW